MKARWNVLWIAAALLVSLDAGAGTLTFEPGSVAFGNVSVSGPPAQQTMTIRNTGTNTIISGFVKTGSGCGEFMVTAPGLPVTLGNNATLIATVTYDPDNRISDTCTITTQDNNGVTNSFGVSGDGISPVVSGAPTPLMFADQPWSSGTGETLNVFITNNGEEPIAASNLQAVLTTATHFTLGTAGPFPIFTGDSAILPVTFNPLSVGYKEDTLTLLLNNDGSAEPNPTLIVRGTGTTEPVSVGDSPAQAGALAVSPSPTRGTVTLSFSVPRPGQVVVDACDLAGRVVARRTAVAWQAGARTETFRAGDAWSPGPGLYFVRVTLDGAVLGIRRVVVVR